MTDPQTWETILQLVVDGPKLQPFLHGELANRRPLVIKLAAPVPEGLTVRKFDQAVRFAAKPTGPHLEVLSFRAGAAEARIEYRYAVEGVAGAVELRRETTGWKLVSETVTER